MINPLVTIAIPAYKCDYLKDAIQSAINQTYNNIEILIVDDKSPYDVYSIVNTFNDSRIRYIRNSENIGGEDPANNWNKCLREAQGDYFCLLCDDDLYMPTFVEMMLKLATKYEHTHIFRSRVSVIDIEGKCIDMYPTSPEFETSENYMLDLFAGYRRQTISEFMYKRNEFVEKGGYCNLPKAMCSDHLTIILQSQYGGIASSTQPLVAFRMSEKNLSGTGQNKKNIKEKIISRKMYTDSILSLLMRRNVDYKDIIIGRMWKQHNNANIHELSWCSKREFCFLFMHRKEMYINLKSFFKAIVNRIKLILR